MGDFNMRVLFITHYVGYYGANKALLQLIMDLKEKKISPIVLVPFDGQFCKVLESNNIEYVIKNFHNWRYDSKKNKFAIRYLKLVYYLFCDFLNILSFYRTLKRKKISLIHTNSSMIPIGGIMAKLLRIPHVWHLREFGEGMHYDNYFYFGKKLSGKIMSYTSDSVLAISQAIKVYYSPIIRGKEIEIIYDGIPIEKVKLAIPFKKTDKKINVCIVGRVSSGKNQLEALKALKFLGDSILEKMSLYVIGDGDTEYLDSLKDFVIKNELTSYVKFLGYRDDVYSLLEKMHIGVVSSEYEGFGLVTIEYMLHKVAVIASNSGANLELIQNEKNGLIYSLGDYVELASRIELLVNNLTFKDILVQNAFDYAKEKFDSKKSAKEIFSIYNKIIK